jgi:DNA-binding MarR family transcriptional regulator
VRERRSVTLLRLLANDQQGGMSASMLGEAMEMGTNEVSKLVVRLSQRRLLHRRPSPVDGRVWLYTLTPTGRAELAKVE